MPVWRPIGLPSGRYFGQTDRCRLCGSRGRFGGADAWFRSNQQLALHTVIDFASTMGRLASNFEEVMSAAPRRIFVRALDVEHAVFAFSPFLTSRTQRFPKPSCLVGFECDMSKIKLHYTCFAIDTLSEHVRPLVILNGQMRTPSPAAWHCALVPRTPTVAAQLLRLAKAERADDAEMPHEPDAISGQTGGKTEPELRPSPGRATMPEVREERDPGRSAGQS